MRYMIESKIGSRLKVEYEDNYKDALITLRRHQQFKTFKSGGISEVQNLEEIKEDIMKTDKKTCVLCKKQYEGWGNNAQPLANGQCCKTCDDTKVLPERINRATTNASVFGEE